MIGGYNHKAGKRAHADLHYSARLSLSDDFMVASPCQSRLLAWLTVLRILVNLC
jgi:hypothetical protein